MKARGKESLTPNQTMFLKLRCTKIKNHASKIPTFKWQSKLEMELPIHDNQVTQKARKHQLKKHKNNIDVQALEAQILDGSNIDFPHEQNENHRITATQFRTTLNYKEEGKRSKTKSNIAKAPLPLKVNKTRQCSLRRHPSCTNSNIDFFYI